MTFKVTHGSKWGELARHTCRPFCIKGTCVEKVHAMLKQPKVHYIHIEIWLAYLYAENNEISITRVFLFILYFTCTILTNQGLK